MKALELAKTVEHWVSCDAGIRGEECRAAAAELRRLAEVNVGLLGALERLVVISDLAGAPYGAWTEERNIAKAAIAKAKEKQ